MGKSNFRNAAKNAKGFFGKKGFDDEEFSGKRYGGKDFGKKKKPFKKGFKGAQNRAMFGEDEGNPFAKNMR